LFISKNLFPLGGICKKIKHDYKLLGIKSLKKPVFEYLLEFVGGLPNFGIFF